MTIGPAKADQIRSMLNNTRSTSVRVTLLALASMTLMEAFAQNGLHLDGVDDYCQASGAGPQGTASRTVEAWVKQDTGTSSQRVVVDWGDMANGHRFTLNLINRVPRIEVGGYGVSSGSALTAGTWHHLAATYDNTASPKMKLYVDGTLVNSGNPTVTVATSNANGIILGMRNDQVNRFNGVIDEVRVWNVARTAAQIQSTKDHSFCTVPGSLVAYYRLDQGTAGGMNLSETTALDASASGNNAALYGFDLFGGTSNWVIGATIMDDYATSLTVNTCDPYTSPGGNTYTSSGAYQEVYTAVSGCDSVVEIQLTIAPIDTSVVLNGYQLTAQLAGAQYQWIDCGLGLPVPGALSQSFTPGYNGSFAVRLTTPTCVDTSGCHTITGVGLSENELDRAIALGPNPTDGVVELRVPGSEAWWWRLIDLEGRVLLASQRQEGALGVLDLSDLAAGMFIVEIERAGARVHRRIVRR